jgi:hypothetical protein
MWGILIGIIEKKIMSTAGTKKTRREIFFKYLLISAKKM